MKDEKYVWLVGIALVISIIGMVPIISMLFLFFLIPLGLSITSLVMAKKSNRTKAVRVMAIITLVLFALWIIASVFIIKNFI